MIECLHGVIKTVQENAGVTMPYLSFQRRELLKGRSTLTSPLCHWVKPNVNRIPSVLRSAPRSLVVYDWFLNEWLRNGNNSSNNEEEREFILINWINTLLLWISQFFFHYLASRRTTICHRFFFWEELNFSSSEAKFFLCKVCISCTLRTTGMWN